MRSTTDEDNKSPVNRDKTGILGGDSRWTCSVLMPTQCLLASCIIGCISCSRRDDDALHSRWPERRL